MGGGRPGKALGRREGFWRAQRPGGGALMEFESPHEEPGGAIPFGPVPDFTAHYAAFPLAVGLS